MTPRPFRPRRAQRGLLRLLAAATAALALASCAGSVHQDGPAAVPDPAAVDRAQSALFDREYKRMDDAMTDGHPVRGTLFKHASFGAKSSDVEFDAEFFGSPFSIFTRSRVRLKDKGGNLDVYHPAGSPYDYYLLGSLYASIARTPWARVPTVYPDPLNVCTITGYQTVCDMQDAVAVTARSGSKVLKRVIRNDDGTETLLTGVTLRAMLKYNFLLNVPAAISSTLTPAQLDHELTARFVLDGKARVQVASISGRTPGSNPFEAEVGFQATGVPSAADFPVVPKPTEYTTVGKKLFYAALDRINNQ